MCSLKYMYRNIYNSIILNYQKFNTTQVNTNNRKNDCDIKIYNRNITAIDMNKALQ